MEPIFCMEYMESKKTITEMFDAYYRFKNLKTLKPFRVPNIKTRAAESATKRYAEIKKISRKDRKIRAEFYEDHFTCMTGDVVQEYVYSEIEGIYETDTTIAFVAGKNRKKDAFLALKKGSVKGKSLGDLKTFAIEHCEKVNSVTYLKDS